MIGVGLLATPGGERHLGRKRRDDQAARAHGEQVRRHFLPCRRRARYRHRARRAGPCHCRGAGKTQLAFETIVNGISNQIESSMGSKGRRIVPLAMTLFLYILFCNWLEMIPTGHSPQFLPAPTGDVNLTYAMALTVSSSCTRPGSSTQGLRRYVGHYFKPYKLLFPINLIEEIASPSRSPFVFSATSSPAGSCFC